MKRCEAKNCEERAAWGPLGGGATSAPSLAVRAGACGAVIDGESFGVWDYFYQRKAVEHGPVQFPQGATLLSVAMR